MQPITSSNHEKWVTTTKQLQVVEMSSSSSLLVTLKGSLLGPIICSPKMFFKIEKNKSTNFGFKMGIALFKFTLSGDLLRQRPINIGKWLDLTTVQFFSVEC